MIRRVHVLIFGGRVASLSIAAACTLSIALVSGCVRNKGKTPEPSAELPAYPVDGSPVAAKKSQLGILKIKVDLRSDGLLLNISGVPANATLECDLDDQPLIPCHDGALFARPADGPHKISAIALIDAQMVAVGESAEFTILPGTGGAIDATDQARNNLTLTMADANFVDGAAVPVTKDFVANFKFVQAPQCQPTLRCKYDSRTSAFWTDCDENKTSFTIPQALLASGLQYLSAQATCGDQIGPILTVFFYGVPDNYEPLMLQALKDSTGQYFASLVKADDCPISQQTFQCAESSTDEFELCTNANVLKDPPAGYRMRLVCDGRTGPTLTFNP